MKVFYFVFLFATLHLKSEAQKIEKWKITDVAKLIETSDSILVINFWATFCVPCIEEIPDLIKYSNLNKKNKVKLYLVSLDFAENYPSKIKNFVARKKYNCNIAWLNETNADYFCPIISEQWSGAIPATLIINKKTGYRKFYEKKLSAPEIEKAIREAVQ
jgi:thiol-disulfide isomerase/thioredoxin